MNKEEFLRQIENELYDDDYTMIDVTGSESCGIKLCKPVTTRYLIINNENQSCPHCSDEINAEIQIAPMEKDTYMVCTSSFITCEWAIKFIKKHIKLVKGSITITYEIAHEKNKGNDESDMEKAYVSLIISGAPSGERLEQNGDDIK